MRKKIFSLTLIALVIASSFSGCGKKVELENVATAMTIGELKNAYSVSTTQEQNELAPFWNVEQDTCFAFHFNSKVEPALAISVHTDPKCEPNSRVGQLNAAYLCDSGVDVVVKPGASVLTENTTDAMWGNAPIYYLRINYDRFSDEVTKLSQPVIVPFTVKSDVSTPTLKGAINENGQFYLTWTPVDKATSYEIYESSVGLRKETNEEIDEYTRSELGYVGDHLKKIGETEETTFTDLKYDNSNSNVTEIGGYTTSQNGFLPLTYFVRAKNKDGLAGNFSMAVESWKFADKMPDAAEIQDFATFPDTITVKMKDASTTQMPVNFTKESEAIDKVRYKYDIPGTLLTGYAYKTKVEGETVEDEHKSPVTRNYAIYEIQNSKSIIPAVTANTLTEAQKQIITPNEDEERTLTTYSSDMRMAVAEMENVRLLNKGRYETSIEALVAQYGSIYGGQSAPAETGDEPPTGDETADEPTIPSEPEVAPETPAEPAETPEEKPSEETPSEEPATPTEEPSTPSEEPATPSEEPATPAEEPVVEEPAEEPAEETPIDQPRPENPDIGDANNNPVPETKYKVFADSAEEEYLARMMIAAQSQVDLKAFPRLQDPTYFGDVAYKVIFQNPYILSANGYEYDPTSQTMYISYSLSADEIAQRQKEISSATTSILSACVNEGMTDDEKVMAIWNKLEDDTSYDVEACAAGMKANFQGIDSRYADAFNTYGIMCKKKGVCQSYALAYKLLLTEAGVDAKVLTGYLDKTLPHAWNIVNVGNNWYWFDVTNNAKNAKIPYMLYETSSDFAKSQDYVLDDRYDLNSNLAWVENTDDSKSFYNRHGLVAETIMDAPAKLAETRKLSRHKAFAVLVKSGISEDQINDEFIKKVAQSLLASGMKAEDISNLKLTGYHNYISFIEE